MIALTVCQKDLENDGLAASRTQISWAQSGLPKVIQSGIVPDDNSLEASEYEWIPHYCQACYHYTTRPDQGQ